MAISEAQVNLPPAAGEIGCVAKQLQVIKVKGTVKFLPGL